MTKWKIGLDPDPWQRTKKGKPVEFRLSDPKWADMAVGDIIEYDLRPEGIKIVQVEVLEVIRYPTFAELLDYCYANGYIELDTEGKPYRTKEEQLQRLHQRYPEERRRQYDGVLGIRQTPLSE